MRVAGKAPLVRGDQCIRPVILLMSGRFPVPFSAVQVIQSLEDRHRGPRRRNMRVKRGQVEVQANRFQDAVNRDMRQRGICDPVAHAVPKRDAYSRRRSFASVIGSDDTAPGPLRNARWNRGKIQQTRAGPFRGRRQQPILQRRTQPSGTAVPVHQFAQPARAMPELTGQRIEPLLPEFPRSESIGCISRAGRNGQVILS